MMHDTLEERVARIISTQQVWVLEQLGKTEATPAAVSETSIILLNLHELSLTRQTMQRCIDTLNQDVERAHAIRQTQGEIIARLESVEGALRGIARNLIIGVTLAFVLLALLIIVITGQFSILQRLVAAFGGTHAPWTIAQ